MANHISQLLEQWLAEKDQLEWVLATIIATEGSSYRKPGAMMFINSLGQYFGLLSGGCLEADIMQKSRQCLDDGHNRVVVYDMQDEDDMAWQLGIGCGGKVTILLQPILASNEFLHLPALYAALNNGRTVRYIQDVRPEQAGRNIVVEANATVFNNKDYFSSIQTPPIRLAVFGGGVDARPLAAMANVLGWQVTLVDHRTGYAREQYFPNCYRYIKQSPETLSGEEWLQSLDAVVILTHNVTQDAQALRLVQCSSANYIGLLGPTHRTEQVLTAANLSRGQLSKPLWNPVGLGLGGELPESIALSITAEIHKEYYAAVGGSLTEQLGMGKHANKDQ